MSVWGAYRVTGIAYCLGLSFSLMSTFEVGVIPGLQIRKLTPQRGVTVRAVGLPCGPVAETLHS